MSKIVYAIMNKENNFATYGPSKFNEDIRCARLYKSKKTALKHYFNNSGNYNDLKLVKIEIKILEEEKIKPDEFAENRSKL